MRNTFAIAILLTAISSAPAFSQAAPPAPTAPPVPEVVAPAAPEPPTGWTASVVKAAPPAVDVPVPEIVKAPPEPRPVPAPNSSEAVQAWAAKEAASAPRIQYVNRDRNELVARMEARKIFVYHPVGPDGVALVPEPSSILAMAYGVAGFTFTLLRRRKKLRL